MRNNNDGDDARARADGDADDGPVVVVGSPFAAAAASKPGAASPPPSPLAMRHPRRRRRPSAPAADSSSTCSSSSSSSCSSSSDDDEDERAPTCLSRLEHTEAAAALSLPVGAWPHFRLLQHVLRLRAEERWQRRRWRNGPSCPSAAPRTIPLGTLVAIHAQEAQHRASRLHPQHRSAVPALARRYWPWLGAAAAAAGGAPLGPAAAAASPPSAPAADLIELAVLADMSPCLLVRRLAEHLLRAPKGAVAEALRDASGAAMRRLGDRAAAAAAAAAGAFPPPQNHHHPARPATTSAPPTTLNNNYHALADALLRDAARAALADPCYSPAADAARALAGHEGEAALGAALRRAGVPFWTEGDLRARGLFKTPDAWLQAPAAVRVPRGWRRPRRRRAGDADDSEGKDADQEEEQGDPQDPEDDWRVIHWVDSKACFGDSRAHGAALEGQYRQYADRYGPGLVVYWAGHASGLDMATWPGWRDDLRRDDDDEEEGEQQEGEGAKHEGGGGGGGGGGSDPGPSPPPWLVVVMDRFPAPEDVRLLPRVRDLPVVGAAAAAAQSAAAAAATENDGKRGARRLNERFH